ncbi:MAG: hypothetical protein QOE71_1005 [Pseudonocardiales bacterium]|nr:hypothetical protein [Pseudonocardiales bacterium]
MPALFSGDLPERPLLYHYTKADTLPLILGSGRIRLSSLDAMNDARESRSWHPSVVADDGLDVSMSDFMNWQTQLDESLRRRAKVACFTADRTPTGPFGGAGQFHRGYARARMWDQYAEHHSGACLILDQERLFAHAAEALSAEGDVRFGAVTYVDRRVGDSNGMLEFRASDLRRGIAVAAEEYLAAHWQELLLTKNLDWMTEEEQRILFVERGALDSIRDVPMEGSLVAVILGERFDPDSLDAIRDLASTQGVDRDWVGRCVWFGGSPQIMPLP